jgi:hypothetical protein
MAVLANSFQGMRLHQRPRLWRLIKQLNRPEIEWVASHCRPSSEALVRLGVSADKAFRSISDGPAPQPTFLPSGGPT